MATVAFPDGLLTAKDRKGRPLPTGDGLAPCPHGHQISRIACLPTTGATLHTDLDSLRFFPPLSTMTTERGDAASLGCRPERVATAIWPRTNPLLVSKTRYILDLERELGAGLLPHAKRSSFMFQLSVRPVLRQVTRAGRHSALRALW